MVDNEKITVGGYWSIEPNDIGGKALIILSILFVLRWLDINCKKRCSFLLMYFDQIGW